MINIDVFSEEKAWSKRLKKKELFFKQICNHFQKNINFLIKKLVLLYFFQTIKYKKLNKNFRNKNKPTDILSFPFNKKIKISKKLILEIL